MTELKVGDRVQYTGSMPFMSGYIGTVKSITPSLEVGYIKTSAKLSIEWDNGDHTLRMPTDETSPIITPRHLLAAGYTSTTAGTYTKGDSPLSRMITCG